MKSKKNEQKLNTQHNLRRDLYVIISMILLAIPVIIIFHLKPLESTLLYFILPSFYLVITKPKKLKRVFVASIGSIFATFALDLFATYNHAWFIPQSQLVIPIRVLGVVPVDDMIWFCSWIMFIAIFYEHFIHRSNAKYISSHFKYAFIGSAAMLLGMLTIFT